MCVPVRFFDRCAGAATPATFHGALPAEPHPKNTEESKAINRKACHGCSLVSHKAGAGKVWSNVSLYCLVPFWWLRAAGHAWYIGGRTARTFTFGSVPFPPAVSLIASCNPCKVDSDAPSSNIIRPRRHCACWRAGAGCPVRKCNRAGADSRSNSKCETSALEQTIALPLRG